MKRSFSTFAAVAAVAGLALSGCGSDSGSGGTNPGADEEQGLVQINAQPRENLQEGGELRFAIGSYPQNWNSSAASGNNHDTATILGFTTPSNFVFDGKAVPQPNTDFLLETELEQGPPQVVKLKLNPEAKWNDGTPISYEDYVGTWKALNGENKEFQPASSDGWEQVESVEQGADEFEIVITYKSAYPDWQGQWSGVINRNITADPKLFNDGMIDKPHPEWMAGPYTLTDSSLNAAEKTVTLVPNDKWWGNKPLLDKVIFREMESALTAQAFQNNEIDVVGQIVTADEFQKASGRPDGEIRNAPGLQWRHFTVNSNSGLLSDKGVRQAITKGINREAIAASDLVGLPVDPSELMLGNHFFMPGQEGYVDNSGDYAYNPEAAAKQLEELGWKLEEGKKYRTNDKGEELEVGYTMLAGVPTSENEGKLFQKDMEQIGVKVNIENVSPDKFNDTLTERNFSIIAFTWVGTPYPMRNIGQIYGCESPSNYSDVCDEKIEELREKADTELDHQKRVDYVNEVDKVIWDNVMTIPLYARRDLTAVPKNLANYGSFGYSSGRPEDIGFMK